MRKVLVSGFKYGGDDRSLPRIQTWWDRRSASSRNLPGSVLAFELTPYNAIAARHTITGSPSEPNNCVSDGRDCGKSNGIAPRLEEERSTTAEGWKDGEIAVRKFLPAVDRQPDIRASG